MWFDYIVVVGCSAVLSFGGFGLVLAIAGHYSAAPAFLLGTVGTVVCTFLGRPVRSAATPAPGARVTAPALGMCFVAIGTTIWNAIYAGHHVVVATDPGVYTVAGRWLASNSSLVVPAGAPWIGKGTFLNWASVGMYPMPNGTLQFQFAHLLPVLMAEGHRIGGDALMFRVPALLNAIALCAIYATGCRVIRRPWIVLAGVTALAVSIPELYFSRDTFSEPATQVLLWGGIWLLLRAYETRRWTVGFLAGLVIGGTLMTRIDAVVYLVPIPLLAAAGWLACRPVEDRRTLLRVYGAVLLGALPTALVGTIDVQRRAAVYYHGLHSEVSHLYAFLALSALASIVIVVVAKALPRVGAWVQAQRKGLSIAAAWIIVIGFVLAWAFRPIGPTSRAGGGVGYAVGQLQKSESLPYHPETYAEQTVQWISWYLGPVLLVLAIAGLCVLAVMAIRRGSVGATVLLAMAGPLTLLYLWNPRITPIQIWAMRRFVPASLPLFALAAAAAVAFAAMTCARLFRGSAWPRRILAAGALGMIAFPLGTTLAVGKFQVQANYLPLIDRTCDTVGPNAAVVFPAHDYDGATLMQTLRSWCEIPTSGLAPNVTPQEVSTLAASWRSEGKTLWVLGNPVLIRRVDPALTPVLIGTAKNPRDLEQTLDRPPQHYVQSTLTISGAPVR
jgi:hypothetical protein